jgi:hypothetical protein
MILKNSDIHVISGELGVGKFKSAYHENDKSGYLKVKDRVLVQRDLISYGPTPHCASLKAWDRARTDYYRQILKASDLYIHNLPADLLYNAHRLKDFESIYVWAGIGLEDQLLILFVVYLVDLVGGNPENIKLVQYETFPGTKLKRPVYSIGWLSPDQIRAHPEPVPLTQAHIEDCRAGWAALTSNSPGPLLQFLASRRPESPYLTAALHYLLRRYPRIESGLDYWDSRILIHVGKRSRLMVKIMQSVWGKEIEADTVPDFLLLYKIHYLAGSELPEPLFKLSGPQTSYRDTKVALTKFGLAVQQGEASFYPANPIDTWAGGVHVSSATGNLWFYQDGELIKKTVES